MRKFAAGIALTTAVTALTGTAASAAPAHATEHARHQRLHAWTLLNDRGTGPTPHERLTTMVDARTTDGHEARGHATVRHAFPDGGVVRVEISIDCLTTGADGAVTVTGPIESIHFTVPPGGTQPAPAPSTWHPETSLTFYPADVTGERRVGWSGANALDYSAPAKATKCGPTAPNTWVIKGGYTLHR
ncbi:hypothetical protein F7Q99_14460 [Streptomyces kaniharaensis]|uniref:Uncharacterized protein n=1 Tax=Streptomyces kaniharaensis TaxID=212423 RepID=A0A6N7KPI7_9ACTN|nr:hypothetical protein [Streptomyces kaniharaensis]MQS13436.1 hypothetical protein [Streptomyces kaniharaensis]